MRFKKHLRAVTSVKLQRKFNVLLYKPLEVTSSNQLETSSRTATHFTCTHNTTKETSCSETSCSLSSDTTRPRPLWNFEPIGGSGAMVRMRALDARDGLKTQTKWWHNSNLHAFLCSYGKLHHIGGEIQGFSSFNVICLSRGAAAVSFPFRNPAVSVYYVNANCTQCRAASILLS